MNNEKIIKSKYGFISLLTLLTGIVIYLLFRDLNKIILFTWIPKPQLFEFVSIPLKQSIITIFLRYHLPDALWFISAVLFLRFMWFYKIKEQMIYIFSFYVIGFTFEISQLLKIIPGTFDLLDLFFMGIAALLEGIIYKFFILRRIT